MELIPEEYQRKFVSIAVAATILGVEEHNLRRGKDYNDLQCYRSPGGHRRYALDDIQRIKNGSTQANATLLIKVKPWMLASENLVCEYIGTYLGHLREQSPEKYSKAKYIRIDLVVEDE